MSLAIVYSRATRGVHAPLVTVEAHLARGMMNFYLVGLPKTAVKESRDRVRSALINSQFEFPRGRITVNLAPADIPKEGGRFDLPIALGILAASGQIPPRVLAEYEFVGELALSGELRVVRGILPVVLAAKHSGRTLIIPEGNAAEAAVVSGVQVLSATHLLEVCAHLKGERMLMPSQRARLDDVVCAGLDLADVRGQLYAKRALEIAASGKHSLLFIGPPGTGKTMLASRLTSILPVLSDAQALESAAIASVSHHGFDSQQWLKIPYRAPHHSSSSVALVGGGSPPKPGEISLAHQGVLFLDELPEFQSHVLESLREPLESGCITISRAGFQSIFPAQFQLIAAMNPCPCGYAGLRSGLCRCTDEKIHAYVAKLSGPLLDRIDMQVEVPALPPETLAAGAQSVFETSATVLARVQLARAYQLQRQQKCNADLSVSELEIFCALGSEAQDLLNQVMLKFHLSARVYHRLLKMARTIADLEQSEAIELAHLSEALTYRCLDRTQAAYRDT